MKVEFKGFYKCLNKQDCELKEMNKDINAIVCEAKDFICNYCKVIYKLIKINGEIIE